MKNLLLIVCTLFFFNLNFYAQTTEPESTLRTTTTLADSLDGWKKGGLISLSLAQAAFNNWVAGGKNSFSLNGLLSLYANLKKGKNTWDNMLDIGYGILQQGKDGIIKTDDKIDLTTKYGRALTKKLFFAALLNFKTQMTPGYNYPNTTNKISDLLAPGYLIVAVGIDYKPDGHFSAFFAPISSKNTIITNTKLADSGAFGVKKATYDADNNLITHGKKFRSEFGGYLRLVYQNTFFKEKNISVLSKLDLFSNYLNNPQNIDVSWETILGFKINKFLSTNITTHLIYDDDIKIEIDNNNDGIIDEKGPRLQFKEVLSIGFTFKF